MHAHNNICEHIIMMYKLNLFASNEKAALFNDE